MLQVRVLFDVHFIGVVFIRGTRLFVESRQIYSFPGAYPANTFNKLTRGFRQSLHARIPFSGHFWPLLKGPLLTPGDII